MGDAENAMRIGLGVGDGARSVTHGAGRVVNPSDVGEEIMLTCAPNASAIEFLIVFMHTWL